MTNHNNFTQEELKELDAIGISFEEKYAKYSSDTQDESILQIIIRSHLYIEYELKKMLHNHLKHPRYLGERLRFIDIMNFVFALGIVPENLYSTLKEINKIRNEFAHDLDYVFEDKDLIKLESTLSGEVLLCYQTSSRSFTERKDKLRMLLFWVWERLVADNLIPDNIRTKLESISKGTSDIR